MIGAGVFAAIGPAAGAAGVGPADRSGDRGRGRVLQRHLVGRSSPPSTRRRAAPTSTAASGSGTFWGYLAGWGFVVGKTASCAAMALTFGAYAAPGAGSDRSRSPRSSRSRP